MNHSISICKAIAIILMVMGHSDRPDWLGWMHTFRMPLFFFVSGYFLKDKYLQSPMLFIKQKVKGLYIPFVQWSLIFLALHNVLYYLDCYPSLYTWKDFGVKAITYLTMMGSEQLLGGYGFLKDLLICSIFSLGIILMTHRYLKSLIVRLLILLACVSIAYGLSILPFKIPFVSSRTFLACFMFISGYFTNQYGKHPERNLCYLLGYFLSISIPYYIKGASGMESQSWYIFPFSLCALAGTFATFTLAEWINKHCAIAARLLSSIGQKTFYILTFHFLSFKLVNYFLIRVMGKTGQVYDFPTISSGGGWWILYVVVGVLVPIILWQIKHWLIQFNWKKQWIKIRQHK